jgi:hypothetical protein
MKTPEETLQRIARYLMLHSSSLYNIGLLNGKTGISIFFYHYARYTGIKRYDDFAGELINEIYKEINRRTPCDFEDGLCGIGWGLEYLIQNHFVAASSNEVLRELDKRITEWDVRRIEDYTLETGLKGIACYASIRYRNWKNENSYINPEYLSDLVEALKKGKEQECTSLINEVQMILENKDIVSAYNPVFEILGKTKQNRQLILDKPNQLGIKKNGYAGIGLHLMKIEKL